MLVEYLYRVMMTALRSKSSASIDDQHLHWPMSRSLIPGSLHACREHHHGRDSCQTSSVPVASTSYRRNCNNFLTVAVASAVASPLSLRANPSNDLRAAIGRHTAGGYCPCSALQNMDVFLRNARSQVFHRADLGVEACLVQAAPLAVMDPQCRSSLSVL